MDIHIFEVAEPSTPEKLLGVDRPVNLAGHGWLGSAHVLAESEGERIVHRLAGTLAASGTLMSCWVSYQKEAERGFAESLLLSVHHA